VSGKGVQETNAAGYQIRWKAEDLSVLETHPLTPGLVLNTKIPSPTSASQTGSSSSLPTNSNSTLSSKAGLGTGAKAGIGIGVVLGITVLTVIGFFLWRTRRSKNTAVARLESDDRGHDAPEVVDHSLDFYGQKNWGKEIEVT
jgi:hypothetical protein